MRRGGERRFRWWIVSALLMLAACTTPQPTVSPVAFPEAVIYSDDFSRASEAWRLFEAENGSAMVRDGELYVEVRGGETSLYVPLQIGTWDDVVISVETREVAGTEDNWMGVLCRQSDLNNYYLFALSADGYYLMMKMRDGLPEALAGPTYSTLIRTGRARNRLTVRCEGSSLRMSVNGRFLVNRSDDDLAGGGIALFADAMGGGGTTVAFDNFSLTPP